MLDERNRFILPGSSTWYPDFRRREREGRKGFSDTAVRGSLLFEEIETARCLT